jgi:hypothetical protein
MTAEDYTACMTELGRAHVVFEAVGDAKDEGCAITGAVRLMTVATSFGDVKIAGKPTMLCSFARQFATWTREVAAPLTLAYTGERLQEIEASAFSCTRRTDKPGMVPSEHARGNAIDIAAFALAGRRRVLVKAAQPNSPQADDLLRALRTTACGYFTTVLGPGADAAHAEHFHFDLAVHGATPNYRICE